MFKLMKKISRMLYLIIFFSLALVNTIGSSTVLRSNGEILFSIVKREKAQICAKVEKIKNLVSADETNDLMDSAVVANVIVFKRLTEECERETRMSSSLLLGLIHGESAGDKHAVSGAGARGVVQFTDIALKDVRRITGRRVNPSNNYEALWGAARFLRFYKEKYKLLYSLSDEEALRYAAIHYLGGGYSVRQYIKGIIVIDKYTGISVSDYANILLKRSQLYRNMLYKQEG